VFITCLNRGGFDETVNFRKSAVLAYNQLVRDNAVAQGYVVSDDGADPRLLDPTDTSVFAADGIHLINAGYAIQAAIEKAAVKAA
jgi:hypothetical protein